MKTTNAMQLKAIINNRAKKVNASPQLMMQNYLFERLLVRLAASPWRDGVVIKGGMLVGSLLGVDSRTTKDLDATVRGFALSHETAERVLRDICALDADDDLTYEFLRTEDIREADEYQGVRAFLTACYGSLAVPLSIDMTTGDAITPSAISYEYPLAFDEGSITVMAYPVETVLAEKVETILSRGIANTRPRDFYDAHMLWKTYRERLDAPMLAKAIEATSSKRGSLNALMNAEGIVGSVLRDETMLARWRTYSRDYPYARVMEYEEGCQSILDILEFCREQKQ